MGKATLVIMAAGIGSRFGGGIKQLEPVGPNGEIIMDYSIYDAREAGFDKVVFVIRKDLEQDFREVIGNRVEQIIDVEYAFQELDDIPAAYQSVFKARKKPWGTGQAILVCKDIVKEPFLVINADDYYGQEAYQAAFHYLTSGAMHNDSHEIGMVSFVLGNTLSENGGVTRGICAVDEQGMLTEINETKNVIITANGAGIDLGDRVQEISVNAPVSMNMWALDTTFMSTLEKGFLKFLEKLDQSDLTKEYLLPTIIGDLLSESQITVKVLQSKDKWFGVTYKEDKDSVMSAINALIENGIYTENIYK